MNSQRRLRYMKALGIPIWLARTHQSNINTQTHTEHTANKEHKTEIVDHSHTVSPISESVFAHDEPMDMQAYEQYAQYDSNTQTTSDFDSIQTPSVDVDALASRLIKSLDTTTPSSAQNQSLQSKSHATSAIGLTQPSSHSEQQSSVSDAITSSTKTAQLDQSTSHINIPVESLNWEDLQKTVQQCQFCEMAKFRSNTVFGSGNIKAKWLFIGEAPDVEDDQQGLPFLAKSGQLLDNILAAINLERDAVYLSNILKCRPPNDRDPHVDEAKHCMNYLHRQIELIQPKVIVVVGRVATKNLLQIKKPLGKMRGYIHYFGTKRIPVVVTYHPRYLLRQPSAKRKVWEDIQLAQSVVQM